MTWWYKFGSRPIKPNIMCIDRVCRVKLLDSWVTVPPEFCLSIHHFAIFLTVFGYLCRHWNTSLCYLSCYSLSTLKSVPLTLLTLTEGQVHGLQTQGDVIYLCRRCAWWHLRSAGNGACLNDLCLEVFVCQHRSGNPPPQAPQGSCDSGYLSAN